MSITYNLYYRQKGTSVWTLGGSNLAKTDGVISGTVSGLTNGTTYEFRFRRVNSGTPLDQYSSVVEGTPTGFVPLGGTDVTQTGSFTTTLDGKAATIVRSSSSLTLSLNANWTWVRAYQLSSAIGENTDFFTTKTTNGNGPGNPSVRNTAVIETLSSKSVRVKLGSTYSYTLVVAFSGNSSGTLSVTAITGI